MEVSNAIDCRCRSYGWRFHSEWIIVSYLWFQDLLIFPWWISRQSFLFLATSWCLYVLYTKVVWIGELITTWECFAKQLFPFLKLICCYNFSSLRCPNDFMLGDIVCNFFVISWRSTIFSLELWNVLVSLELLLFLLIYELFHRLLFVRRKASIFTSLSTLSDGFLLCWDATILLQNVHWSQILYHNAIFEQNGFADISVMIVNSFLISWSHLIRLLILIIEYFEIFFQLCC